MPYVVPIEGRGARQAICKALREREAALLTVQALEEELEKKRRGVAALEEEGRAVFGGDKSKTRRVAGLNADKAALEARARILYNRACILRQLVSPVEFMLQTGFTALLYARRRRCWLLAQSTSACAIATCPSCSAALPRAPLTLRTCWCVPSRTPRQCTL